MKLARTDRQNLYFIAFVQPRIDDSVSAGFEVAKQSLLEQGLVEVRDGLIVATQAGLDALSPLARQALQRPTNYVNLPPEEQWAVDKKLGILDWDGC